MVIQIDTNVLLDVLQNRESFVYESGEVIRLCGERVIDGYMAAHSVSNIFFILRKNYSIGQRRLLLTGLLKTVRVAGVEHESVVKALKREEFSDFEDCLQDECAKEIGADYIITRNIKDFACSEVPAITPERFLEIME